MKDVLLFISGLLILYFLHVLWSEFIHTSDLPPLDDIDKAECFAFAC